MAAIEIDQMHFKIYKREFLNGCNNYILGQLANSKAVYNYLKIDLIKIL